jgi:putative radical SAM enzyme (TIGR03279 family)
VGQAAGLRPGDRLLAINQHPLRDIIDVQFYAANETLKLAIDRDGLHLQVIARRDYGQDLGLSFENPTFDIDIRRCTNNCDFCFVKQNAPGMRGSLYVKDDDYRYSFLFGNFTTLTNLTDDDWTRLGEQRLSPLYVSVHATDLELRRRFLARKNAPDVMAQLRRLANLGIEVHTQVVLVPGMNDGKHLAGTIAELASLYLNPVASVGVVPIGLTKYHRGACRTYSRVECSEVLDQLEQWQGESRARVGSGFVYPSDEWYLVAGREVPAAGQYDGFPQIENGVGMVRQLLDDWDVRKATLPGSHLKSASLVCGTLIAPVLSRIIEELRRQTGVELRLVPVVNRFFGQVTTVSGLLTGQDVIAALQGQRLGDVVLLPSAMFTGRSGGDTTAPDITLDDMQMSAISAQLEPQSGVQFKTAATMSEALAALR